MRVSWKIIALVVLALGVIALLATAFRPSPIQVDATHARRGPLRVTVEAEGKTRVRDRFVIAAPVAGRLSRISLRRGDLLKRDAVIARIEPLPLAPLDPRQLAEARARVVAAEELKHQAEAIVERVSADCEQARREYERAERLLETGDIARQEFERVRNTARTCQKELEAAQFKARAAASEVEVAKAALLAVEQAGQSGQAAVVFVRAPARGQVLRVIEESERVIIAGAPLVEMSNPSNLELVIDVLSTDAVKVNPGAPVWIENWGGEEALQAKVRLIEPSAFTKVSALGIEEQRVNVIADFVDPPGPLGDGYRIEARIVIWESENVLLVPASALFRHGQGWSVFVIENGRARQRKVEVGHRTAFDVEVRQGLTEGTEVILHPTNQITDGLRVKTQ
jgi:HlyD family secretion protein